MEFVTLPGVGTGFAGCCRGPY